MLSSLWQNYSISNHLPRTAFCDNTAVCSDYACQTVGYPEEALSLDILSPNVQMQHCQTERIPVAMESFIKDMTAEKSCHTHRIEFNLGSHETLDDSRWYGQIVKKVSGESLIVSKNTLQDDWLS